MRKQKIRIFLLNGQAFMLAVVLLAAWHLPVAGTSPGESTRLGGGYVEYIQGNFPLILSVPHGGYDTPPDIPERTGRVAKNQDIYTIEVAREMIRFIYRETGKYPYVVINHLHRTRLDANRNLEEAAGGNPAAEAVWNAYQSRLEQAGREVADSFGKGLFIDLHGHRHAIARTELGYLLSAEELKMEKEFFNEGWMNEFSSIRNLLENNALNLPPSELIRGRYSLGALLRQKGQVCVPDDRIPYPPDDEPYFSGGYNTSRHGSSGGGSIDGIQVEIDLPTRTDEERRMKMAEDLALSLLEFIDAHYYGKLPE